MLREVLGQSEQPLSSGGCACSAHLGVLHTEILSLHFPPEPRKRFLIPGPSPHTGQGDVPLRDQGTGHGFPGTVTSPSSALTPTVHIPPGTSCLTCCSFTCQQWEDLHLNKSSISTSRPCWGWRGVAGAPGRGHRAQGLVSYSFFPALAN